MRILALDHYFGPDIDALEHAARGKYELKRVSYQYFRDRAVEHLPPAVFDSPNEYHKPIYEEARKKWANVARRLLFELYLVYRFDIVISPSDTFFYIRDVIQAAKELGVPFVVVQKETTISPDIMSFWPEEIGRIFPFISDYMTVCSQRHKEFWLRAGARSDSIEVTGQPRFDFYKHPEQWVKLDQLAVPLDTGKPTILFFSYDLKGAYLPHDQNARNGPPWSKLRQETEDVLTEIAKKRGYNLLIKPHPQQDVHDLARLRARLRELSGENWRKSVFLIEGEFDTRQLIVNADIIVGFQTTALLEALLAGKEVIYTFWTKEVHSLRDALIPYHRYSRILTCARSPEDLVSQILTGTIRGAPTRRKGNLKPIGEHLGPVDGRASERVLTIINGILTRHQTNEEQTRMREYLNKMSPNYCSRERRIARIIVVCLSILTFLAYPLKKPRKVIWSLALRARARVVECKEPLGPKYSHAQALTGTTGQILLSQTKYLLRRASAIVAPSAARTYTASLE
jgi:hypothetical protein